MNTKTDEARVIDSLAEEGLLETTHYIISYAKKQQKLALEYNQSGAKINDFVLYIQNVGLHKNVLQSLGYLPLIKNELSRYINRINKTSEFIVKIHKNNIEKIKNIDTGIYAAAKASSSLTVSMLHWISNLIIAVKRIPARLTILYLKP